MNAGCLISDAFVLESAPVFKIDKRRIAEKFGRAAKSYDASANLQQLVASRTRLGLPELADNAVILDMGCGTGKETLALRNRYPENVMAGLDLSDGMLTFAQKQPALVDCKWIVGDIEELPFAEETFDLIFSSLAIQWCESLSEVLAQVYRVLKPGGWFVFSTLAAGSLFELQTAWRNVDDEIHVNSYETFERQMHCVAAEEFQIISLHQRMETLYYPAVLNLLREIKALGANTVVGSDNQSLLGRRTLRQLESGYLPFQISKGLPASYQVIYGVLCKPE